LLKDGLTDVYDQKHMGFAGEDCAKRHGISRKEQDDYAILSYKRAAEATQKGYFKPEIVEVEVKQGKGASTIVSEDEEYKKTVFDKIPSLNPAFLKEGGTITAANASKLNDGACSLLLMSAEKAKELGLNPIARILGFADAEHEPVQFPTAPSLAIPKALKNAGIQQSDVDFWEVNEAFSVVALANQKLLNLNMDKLNVHGGGVALGHPIGMSGARITAALAHILRQYNGKIGVASICNGGGGASAIVIERL
jgi:acetyl-CoA C-acetyltransferase